MHIIDKERLVVAEGVSPKIKCIKCKYELSMKDALVIIPTYNERENIEKMIRRIFSLFEGVSILVVDDASPDATASIVEVLQSEFSLRLYLLKRDKKYGLGTAYVLGFKWALLREYKYIFEMDADFSHDPKDLFRLYRSCVEEADLAIGSRYLDGVNVVNWPTYRVLISRMASIYVRWIFGLKVQDTTTGFKCYRREVLETIFLDKIQFKGYAFQIEMKYRAWKGGFVLKEISTVFTNRIAGNSKMNGNVFYEAFFGIFWFKLCSYFHKYPRKKELL